MEAQNQPSMNEQDYIQKGFNQGYILQQHAPELAQSLKDGFSDKEHPYAQGFNAGSEQWQKEQENTREPSKFDRYLDTMNRTQESPSHDKEQEQDLER